MRSYECTYFSFTDGICFSRQSITAVGRCMTYAEHWGTRQKTAVRRTGRRYSQIKICSCCWTNEQWRIQAAACHSRSFMYMPKHFLLMLQKLSANMLWLARRNLTFCIDVSVIQSTESTLLVSYAFSYAFLNVKSNHRMHQNPPVIHPTPRRLWRLDDRPPPL